jgi:two-component system, OmpR family, response regulator MprA
MAMRVLVADDDAAVRDALRRALASEDYDVVVAADGEETLRVFAESPPDGAILDVMMPGPDGLEVCRRLRSRGDSTPILLLTARRDVSDRVAGLDAGADDYLAKPFSLDELLARVRALLRRAPERAETLRFLDIEVDLHAHRVRRGERTLELTRTEFALLELLLRNIGRVLTRSEILTAVWGYDFGPTSNSLEVYVGYLRRKLEAAGEPRVVQTVRGVGYVLREEP